MQARWQNGSMGAVYCVLVALAAACGDDVTARAPHRSPDPPEAETASLGSAPAIVLAAPTARDGEDQVTCVARLSAETPVEVSATLVDLGWTDFLSDACGAAIAVRDRAPLGCDALSARALRERCRLRVAIASSDISACPPARTGDGHDALCVALASGNAGLCRGTSIVDSASCRALLSRDAELCHASPSAEARCRSEFAELRALLPDADPATSFAAIPEPELTLEVRRAIPGSTGVVVSEPETVVFESFERGATLTIEGGAMRIVIGDGAARGSEPTALLEAELAADIGEDGAVEATLALGTAARLELRLPDVGPLTGGTGEIVIVSLEPRLGGRLEGRIRAELFAGVGTVRVSGRFVTFVRDRSP